MAKGGRSRSFGGFVAGMPRSSVAHLRIVGKELQHLADIVQRHLRQVGFRGRAGAGMFDGIGMDLDRYIYNVCVKVCALGQTKLDLLFRPRLLSKTLRSLLSFNSSWSTSSHSRMLTACCTTQVFSRWKPLENPGKVWPKKSSRLLSLVVETLSHRHLNTQIGFNIHNYSLFLIVGVSADTTQTQRSTTSAGEMSRPAISSVTVSKFFLIGPEVSPFKEVWE